MAAFDFATAIWRTSTYSTGDGNCVEVAPVWRTSTYSSGQGNCVEVAPGDCAVAIRDTKDREGPVLTVTPTQWCAFLHSTKNGSFDLAD